VSLLKDCYISWSRERVERWVKGYRRVLGNLGANVGDSEYQFIRWFDLIGVQRHVKVLGIFCRLWHRDGKIGYLGDLPLTFQYVIDACRRYPELVEFGRWLESSIAPLLAEANARETQRAQALAAAQSRKAAKKRKVARKRKPARKRKAVKRKVAKKRPARKSASVRRNRKTATRRQAKRKASRMKRKPARIKRAAKRRGARRRPK